MPEVRNIPTSPWMDAAEVISWIAFRDARPKAEWDELCPPRHAWRVNNLQYLLLALSAQAKGCVWPPPALPPGKERDIGVYRARRAIRRAPPFSPSHYRVHAERLIRETGLSPAKLVWDLGIDMIRQKRFERAIKVAKQELLAAARGGLAVFARKAKGERFFDSGATHKRVKSRILLGRVINEDGWIRPAERSESDDDGCHRDVREDAGQPTSSAPIQYYDDAHFKTAEVLVQWPARLEHDDERSSITKNQDQDWETLVKVAPGRTPDERRDHALIEWARIRWPDPNGIPGRDGILSAHRHDFGNIPGINDRTIRVIRSRLATDEAKRGGARTHKRAG